MNGITRQKNNREVEVLNNTVNRHQHNKGIIYIFCSNTYGTVCRVDHILSHKKILNKLKNIEIIQGSFPNSGMKLEFTNIKKLNPQICRNEITYS